MSEKNKTPNVDFSTFIISLAANAIAQMGLSSDAQAKGIEKNLDMAAYTIDIIDMLKEKTNGNLTEVESKLIDSLLVDLKLKFVEVKKKENDNG